MSLYILDTDTLTLLNWNDPAVLRNCVLHIHDEIATTIISVEEQLSGWHRALRQVKSTSQLTAIYERMSDSVRSLRLLSIHSFSPAAAQRYDQLQALKLGIKKMDLRIAAVTLERQGVLVTRNKRDFQRIPSLAIIDWSV
jgi:tRNA(fMet)-specific endonuclease VapC